MRALVVSIHDVAPSTIDEARVWRALVAELVAGPMSLLLVPGTAAATRGGRARAWVGARAGGGRHPQPAAGRDLLERLLSQGRRPLTHAALADTWRYGAPPEASRATRAARAAAAA